MDQHTWEKIPVARKTHKCIICKEDILPGTKYVNRTSLSFYGGMRTVKFHILCEDRLDDHRKRNA